MNYDEKMRKTLIKVFKVIIAQIIKICAKC